MLKSTRVMAIGMTVLLIASPVAAQDGDGYIVVDRIDLCEGDMDCPAVDVNPWVHINLNFELKDCTGTKTKIKENSVTVGGGFVKGGPVWAVLGFVSFKSTDLGWRWSFTCTFEITQDVWAEGGDSFLREVRIEAQTPTGLNHVEASCFYDGIISDYCRTPSILQAGDKFVITGSSDGITDGYPEKISAESIARGVNKPADSNQYCVIHPPCYTTPSLGELIDQRAPVHAPVRSDEATIKWGEDLHIALPEPTLLEAQLPMTGFPEHSAGHIRA